MVPVLKVSIDTAVNIKVDDESVSLPIFWKPGEMELDAIMPEVILQTVHI